jgi:hypothetical protein
MLVFPVILMLVGNGGDLLLSLILSYLKQISSSYFFYASIRASLFLIFSLNISSNLFSSLRLFNFLGMLGNIGGDLFRKNVIFIFGMGSLNFCGCKEEFLGWEIGLKVFSKDYIILDSVFFTFSESFKAKSPYNTSCLLKTPISLFSFGVVRQRGGLFLLIAFLNLIGVLGRI